MTIPTAYCLAFQPARFRSTVLLKLREANNSPDQREQNLHGAKPIFCRLSSDVIEGTQAAAAVGIPAMRQQCQHFREWIESNRSPDGAAANMGALNIPVAGSPRRVYFSDSDGAFTASMWTWKVSMQPSS
jgi:hypothetical protein